MFHSAYDDLHWFRRGRHCIVNGHAFLTGELDEALIQELVDLRDAWFSKMRPSIRRAERLCTAKSRIETVPLEEVQTFVQHTAYWDHPKSYSYVNAPGHASRVYKHRLGWAVDFGANTFLPGMAIARCFREMAHVFQKLEDGRPYFREDAKERLKRVIYGCIATQDGDEYNGYYPREGDYMRFGTQLVSINDGADFILERADPKHVLMSRAPRLFGSN